MARGRREGEREPAFLLRAVRNAYCNYHGITVGFVMDSRGCLTGMSSRKISFFFFVLRFVAHASIVECINDNHMYYEAIRGLYSYSQGNCRNDRDCIRFYILGLNSSKLKLIIFSFISKILAKVELCRASKTECKSLHNTCH